MKTIKELKAKIENEIKKSSQVFIIGNNEPDFDLYQIVIEAYAIQADNLPLDTSIEDAYTIYLNQNK